MQLTRTSDAFRVTVLDSATSTNDVMTSGAAETHDFDVVLTTTQTRGRGRLGREWTAPPGTSLAMSVLVRPVAASGDRLAMESWGWLPLLAGLAMTRTVSKLLPERRAQLKWPNDVLVEGHKVSGILSELLADASGVVIGAGLNLSIAKADLPTSTSTSLALEGCPLEGDELVDAACVAYLGHLRALIGEFVAADGDVERSGLRVAVERECATIGAAVRVELPGRDDLTGTAVALDSLGRLVLRAADGVRHPVAAGDVTHLRLAAPTADLPT